MGDHSPFHSSLAPACCIDTAPTDILRYIFDLASNAKDASEDAPIVLSQVSTLWRDIVNDTPTLWSWIQVKATLRPVGHNELFLKRLRQVRRHLAMSKGCPLTLDIVIRTMHKRRMHMYHNDHPGKDAVNNFRGYTRILSTILSAHLPRFQEFRLTADESYSIRDLQRFFLASPMPLLTFWRVVQNITQVLDNQLSNPRDQLCPSTLLRPDDVSHFGDTPMYPKLKDVKLISVPMIWSRFYPQNLQTLSLCLLPASARPTALELRAVLLASTHTLEVLDLDGCVQINEQQDPKLSFSMPHVRSLKLGYKVAEELVPLLEWMNVPNLLQLEITDHCRSMATPERRYSRLTFDSTIHALLTVLTMCVPLANLTRLALRHVRFLPYFRHLDARRGEYVSVRNRHGTFIPATLFMFLGSLTALQTLALTGPDYAIMGALNYWPPMGPALGSRQAEADGMMPVPSMTHLRLDAFNLILVREFIVLRVLAMDDDSRMLGTLDLEKPKSWVLYNLKDVAKTVKTRPTTFKPHEGIYLTRDFQ